MTHRAHIHTDSVKCHQRSRKLAKMIKSHRHRCWGRTQGWKMDILEKILFNSIWKKKHLLKKDSDAVWDVVLVKVFQRSSPW